MAKARNVRRTVPVKIASSPGQAPAKRGQSLSFMKQPTRVNKTHAPTIGK